MYMKLTAFFLSALMLSTAAQAAALPRLAPSKLGDAPTCFKREYTVEHMRKNPQQKLEEMYVKVSWKKDVNEEGYKWSWIPGEVVGVSRGVYYGNTAYCSVEKGAVKCAIDCDGGSFSLRHSPRFPGAVNFVVTKDYYFPLFKNRMSNEMEQEIESISLDDEANRIYRLTPVDAGVCDQAIQRITEEGQGGC